MTHGGNLFAAARNLGRDWREILDFSASINPLGPSPKARAAILDALDRIAHYPEPDSRTLREALAAAWNIDPHRILAGNGATELLFDWCRFVGTGTIAVPAFSEFHRAWPGARLCALDDPAVWPATGPLVLTRPANPTGWIPDRQGILDFARSRRDPVLVDESFIDFTDAPSLTPCAHGNLFVLRSLTKFWALPGLRVGVLIGDIAPIARDHAPWTVNAFAEAAVIASLSDVDHARRTRAFVAAEAAWLAGELSRIDSMTVTPPQVNYLYVTTPHATGISGFGAQRGILIRDCTGWPGLPAPAIRVAVRTRRENEELLRMLRTFACGC